LAEKLQRVTGPLTDERPGEARRLAEPRRPPDLVFAERRKAPSMPHPSTFVEPRKRAIAHHILANHELQALEVMAWVLLAFPEAPPEFRQGLALVMADEQRHTRMHADQGEILGIRFGELPVNCYIWKKSQQFQSVLDYLAGLPLTFEGRNLDHTLEFEDYFARAGDPKSAAIMQAIHRDEIHHVAFGLDWLRKLKPAGQSDWDTYVAHLHWPLRPDKSVGDIFHIEPRIAAGMSADFVERLRPGNNRDPATDS
jgi:uncharacterized ferritin-like protein (DUF455 family)